MENKINDEQIVDSNKKPTPFLKKVNELEKKVDAIESKLNIILSALKTRR